MIIHHMRMRMVVESKKINYLQVILSIYKMRKKAQCAVLKNLANALSSQVTCFLAKRQLLVPSQSDPSKKTFFRPTLIFMLTIKYKLILNKGGRLRMGFPELFPSSIAKS